MRIALLSDIHGNPVALDAVLADAQSMAVETYWVLGDIVAIGPEPVATLERLAGLSDVSYIRGNTDRYVVTGDGPPPSLDEAKADPELVALFAHVTASFAWTRGYISAHGWFDWLAGLPMERRLTLPDGTRLLGVHASPGRDDGEGIHPGRSDAELAELVAHCEADLVCVGHTHEPLNRRVGGVRVVNPGSVSNPLAPDLRASYAVIDATQQGYEINHRRVQYDNSAVVEAVRKSHHPAAEFIISHQLGHRQSRTPHPDHQDSVN